MNTGICAEFRTPAELLDAVTALRKRGYRRLETFTPYPIHGLEAALGTPRSRLPWIVLPFGLGGAALAYALQLFCNWDYPINVGGRPLHSAPAFIPITFEMGVLSAAISGVLVFLIGSRLPELYSPVFDIDGFESASVDRFWLGVDDRDRNYDAHQTPLDLSDVGALTIGRARRRDR